MTSTAPRTPRTVVPIDAPPPLTETFDRARVTELRHSVAAFAEASGLTGERLDDFVLVVNELITNAVRHGGGRGRLRLWRASGTVTCEISDHGSGIDADRLDDRRRPAPDTTGGWGLWLARRLSDELVVQTGPAGTTVRISASLTTDEPAAG
ncbi:ATP-binding protein [Micromonospora sp. NBC_01699]|uniref:ATP-binding protein n=1 Tax=Micromonospora sp. NBC_01699 TaxID=2975984 RepID=UPI002E2B13A7|nr:ATP-binding protein [Micromonospora sp. NBC_01699]